MNFIILYMTAKFSKIDFKWYKISIGASIGAIYVISSYIFLFYSSPMIIAKIILSVLMVCVSFRLKNKKIFFRTLTYFYIITFFIGGISFGIAYFFNVVTIYDEGILYVEEFPVIVVALSSLIALILGKYVITFIKSRRKIENLVYKIKVKIMEKNLEINALYDSGHSVNEPFTNYPVVIIEERTLENIIPSEILEKIKDNNFNFDDEWKSKLRVIPISTVSSEKEILAGFKTDEFIVYNEEKEKEIKNVIVAICNKKLSKDESYSALIGRDVF